MTKDLMGGHDNTMDKEIFFFLFFRETSSNVSFIYTKRAH